MVSKLLDKTTFDNNVQFIKVPFPIDNKLSGKITLFKTVHSLNTRSSNVSNPYSNSTFCKFIQDLKASFLIIFTLLGISI